MKIGIFDSGVGGLTVVNEIRKKLPDADIWYVGDSGNLPYGTKSKEELTVYVRNILAFLAEKEVHLLIFACNTATSLLLEEMREGFATPMMGVIEPGVRMAMEKAKKGIGLIATPNTVLSKGYEKVAEQKGLDVPLHARACEQLVKMVEDKMADGYGDIEGVRRELSTLPVDEIDTLILGCTHYPLVSADIECVTEGKLRLVNPAEQVAKDVCERSIHYPIGSGQVYLYTSGDAERFARQATTIIGSPQEVTTFHHVMRKTHVSN